MSMANDYLKHNEAMRLNWRILYFMGHDLNEKNMKKTITYVIDTLEARPITIKPAPATAEDIFTKLREEWKKKHDS